MISPSPPPPPRVSWERDLLGLIRACSSSPPLLKQIHSHLLRRHLLRRHPRLSLASSAPPRSLSLYPSSPHTASPPLLPPLRGRRLRRAAPVSTKPRSAPRLQPLLWNVSPLRPLPPRRPPRPAPFRAMPCRTLASGTPPPRTAPPRRVRRRRAHLFDRMPRQKRRLLDHAVAGYSRNGDNERAVRAFEAMMPRRRPNEFAPAAALSACARMGALEIGIRIHNYVRDNNFSADGAVGTALVDMYAKCGRIDCAGRVFDGMSQRDVLTWTAMIMGWAVHGHWQKALQCFEDMKCSCIEPDEGVFLAVLMACSHSGKVEKGLEIFDTMTQEYRIEPTVKHYTCMVDLFGRAGRLEEALDYIKSMPVEPDFVVWGALFTACRAHKNVEMSEFASNKLLELKPSHHGSYIFLSNMYAGAGRWEDVEKVRVSMKDRGVEKAPGWSCIELEGKAHNFVAGDRSHPRSKDIYCKLEELEVKAREKGYEPNTEWVLHNIEEEDKEDSLGCHSEKLALALGLLSAPKGEVVIRIVKNLRVCGDCHSLMKFASELYGREIVLRDLKRFHHFQDGQCSCGDYW
ncbi:pentatricopeptide repeat-containing protein At1g04840-like [Ananas comosus]|uniref:Pentatricopeptide repeat-containing protein At1g04840-like n=1 Tax=Ananas comosus TaxID=4615 RepID=A0A6P5GXP8_ANACO|nr:pentatricopeptide repeat-containing protein At1g04840-like [Ananas comosus]